MRLCADEGEHPECPYLSALPPILFHGPVHGEPGTVCEHGLLTVPDEVWDLAVRRAAAIGPLARADVVGLGAVDAAAGELGVSRRQVYVLLRR